MRKEILEIQKESYFDLLQNILQYLPFNEKEEQYFIDSINKNKFDNNEIFKIFCENMEYYIKYSNIKEFNNNLPHFFNFMKKITTSFDFEKNINSIFFKIDQCYSDYNNDKMIYLSNYLHNNLNIKNETKQDILSKLLYQTNLTEKSLENLIPSLNSVNYDYSTYDYLLKNIQDLYPHINIDKFKNILIKVNQDEIIIDDRNPYMKKGINDINLDFIINTINDNYLYTFEEEIYSKTLNILDFFSKLINTNITLIEVPTINFESYLSYKKNCMKNLKFEEFDIFLSINNKLIDILTLFKINNNEEIIRDINFLIENIESMNNFTPEEIDKYKVFYEKYVLNKMIKKDNNFLENNNLIKKYKL